MFLRSGGKRFVGALDDALRSNVDPASGRHLAVHRELEGFKAIEFVSRGPMWHEIRVCNQNTW